MNAGLRVLCLHEDGSDALQLKETLQKVGDRLYLKHGIDLVFVNAPLVVNDENGCNDTDNGQKRTWWEDVAAPATNEAAQPIAPEIAGPEVSDVSQQERQDPFFDSDESNHDFDEENTEEDAEDTMIRPCHLGLDASLCLLRQVWSTSNTVGILGVGQGASMTALLTLFLQQQQSAQEENNNTLLPAQFAIFINARLTLFSDVQQESFHFNPKPQFLHMFGGDGLSSSETKLEDVLLLHRQFGGELHEEPLNTITSGEEGDKACLKQQKHWVPSTEQMNRIGRFLVEQKKRLTAVSWDKKEPDSAQSAALVALKQELYYTELEANALIAKEIAANPPKALMAVIQPSAVTGRQQGDVRPPGGGAPCPSEFLLHRSKRDGAAESGPSRVHPSNTKENTKESSS